MEGEDLGSEFAMGIITNKKRPPKPEALLCPELLPNYIWIGLPVTAIAASLIASLCVGWAWQV